MTLSNVAPTLPAAGASRPAAAVGRWRDELKAGRAALEAAFRARPTPGSCSQGTRAWSTACSPGPGAGTGTAAPVSR